MLKLITEEELKILTRSLERERVIIAERSASGRMTLMRLPKNMETIPGAFQIKGKAWANFNPEEARAIAIYLLAVHGDQQFAQELSKRLKETENA